MLPHLQIIPDLAKSDWHPCEQINKMVGGQKFAPGKDA